MSAHPRRRRARAAAVIQSSLLVAGLLPWLGVVAPSPALAATNYGLGLNGSSQYVTFGPAAGLGAAQFTLELWFNKTGAGVGTSTGSGGIASAIPLLTKGRAEAENSNVDMNYFLGIDATSGRLVADFEEGTSVGGTPGLNHPVSGATVVTSNAWHHAAATYDGQTWRLYLDGNDEGSLTLSVARPPRSDSIQHAALGSALTSTGAAAGFFQGVVDEARIWNTARTQAQIQAAKDTDITAAQTGLIGHWGLNEGAGTVVNNTFGSAGVNGAHLPASPAPTWASGYSANPARNYGLGLNGSSQYVTFGAAPGLGAAQFTLELWFNRTGAGVPTNTSSAAGGGLLNAIPLLTKGRGEADAGSNVDLNYFLGIDSITGKLVADFEEGVSAGGSPSLNHSVSGTTVISSNAWHHAAATYDGQTWRLYLDGNDDGSLTLSVARPPRSDSIQHAALGTAMTSTGVAAGFFQGVIDEARVWNLARTQAQIQAAKDTDITAAQTGLIGHWGLNEGAGTVANNTFGSAGVNGSLAPASPAPTWTGGYVVPDSTPPAPPTGLAASATVNTGIGLSWSANSESDLAGYNVYRSTASPVSTAGSPLNGSLLTSPSYTDSTIVGGTTYFYRVVAVDTSANKSNGSNEASTSLTGNFALTFNGTGQYVTFGPATGLGVTTFTLEAWFKWTGGGSGTSTGSGGIASAIPLVTKGRAEAETPADVNMNYFLGIDAASGKLVGDFEDNAGGVNHPVTGNAVVSTNAWHHVAATYDGTTWRLYLDGDLDKSLVAGAFSPEASSIQHAAIGSALTSTGATTTTGSPQPGFFAGTIDEARIWSVARTLAQIRATKDIEIGTPTAGLLAEWRLNEGIGSSVGDASGQAVSGTTTNGPTWVAGFAAAPSNFAPEVDLVAPAEGATGTTTAPELSVTPTDPESGPLTVTFRGRAYGSGVFGLIATNSGVASGSATATTWAGRGAGQRYEWYVTVSDGANTTSSPTWTFNTTPAADPVIVGGGDIAYCPDGSTNTGLITSSIVDGVAGRVFTAGDNVYMDGTPTEFATCYDASWGGAPSHDLKSRTKPAPGNHDWNTANLAGYFGYFGTAAGDPATGRSYYSFDEGAFWHVVILDSECAKVGGGCTATSPQVNWFRSDLAANAAKNVIVIWHKPRFSSGATNLVDVQPFWDLAYQFGVDLILVGHDHVYERMVPMNAAGVADATTGITQITVGTGGEDHHTFGSTRSTSLVRNSDTFGILKLTLHQGSFDWVFLPESGKTFTDSGSQAVHASPDRAPTISSVTVSPTNPTTNQTLTASVTASDPDGDTLTYAYQWFKGVASIGGATGSTLNLATAGNGDRGDSITVRVTASDGVLTSAPVTSSAVTVVNSPPTATVSISPTAPTTNQTLTATATKADADGDVVALTFVWKVNGGVVKTTPNSTLLSDTLNLATAGNGDRGQVISVEVTPADTTVNGTIASSSVTVANSLPALVSASITETSATTNQTLHATAGATTDADGDVVTLGYQWTRNGVDIAGATTSSLDLSITGNGDRGNAIAVRVTPNDGVANGTAITSAALTISNSAPVATVSLDPAAPDTSAVLTATATKADADVDAVTLTFVWRVNGTVRKTTANATITTDTFDLFVSGNGDAGDTVSVLVTPSDGTVSGSAANASATVLADTTPPAAPGAATMTTTSASILLDWDNGVEGDLAGYRAYRGFSVSGQFTLLTPTLLTTSAYTDVAPVVGDIYYRVTSVDTSGNESGATTTLISRSIALRGVSSSQSTSASISVPKPSGTSSGDVLVAVIDLLGAGAINGPSGWTQVRSDVSGTSVRQSVFTHVAGSSDPSSYAFPLGSSQGATALLAAYVGVDTATPVDASNAQAATGSTITGPSVTAGANGLLLMASGIATSATIAPASGMTERVELTTSGKAKLDTELADLLLGAAAPTGNKIATGSKAGANIGQLIALRASGSPPPPPPPPTIPGAPRNLAASASSTRVSLSWLPPTSDGGSAVTTYAIYRGTAANTETWLTTIGNVTTYQDTAVTINTTYYYKVRAVNGIGEGPDSNEVSGRPATSTAPGAPTNLTASTGKPRTVTLSWRAPTNNGGATITGYQIFRSTTSGSEVFLISVGNVTTYKDTSALSGVRYYYWVEAVNSVGASPPSNEATAIAK